MSTTLAALGLAVFIAGTADSSVRDKFPPPGGLVTIGDGNAAAARPPHDPDCRDRNWVGDVAASLGLTSINLATYGMTTADLLNGKRPGNVWRALDFGPSIVIVSAWRVDFESSFPADPNMSCFPIGDFFRAALARNQAKNNLRQVIEILRAGGVETIAVMFYGSSPGYDPTKWERLIVSQWRRDLDFGVRDAGGLPIHTEGIYWGEVLCPKDGFVNREGSRQQTEATVIAIQCWIPPVK